MIAWKQRTASRALGNLMREVLMNVASLAAEKKPPRGRCASNPGFFCAYDGTLLTLAALFAVGLFWYVVFCLIDPYL